VTQPSYPRTIDSGTGERLTILRRVPGSHGDRLEAENVVRPGSGPPMHAHLLQLEVLTVREGRMGYQRRGGPEQIAEQGDTATFEPGEPHRFWNAGESQLRVWGYIEPADNTEYFLTQLFTLTREGGGRMNLFDAAFLIQRYRSEFVMYAIPPIVQRVVFPLVVAVGKILGKYGKFANAPAPIRRRPGEPPRPTVAGAA
jgi:quercetin dioxygenase-like cupin family protein